MKSPGIARMMAEPMTGIMTGALTLRWMRPVLRDQVSGAGICCPWPAGAYFFASSGDFHIDKTAGLSYHA